MINLSKYRKGKLVLIQRPVGLKIISDIVDVLLAEGRARVYDPYGAMHSRIKEPRWDIFYEAKNRVVQSTFPEGAYIDKAMEISNWFEAHMIFPQYDLDDTEEGYFTFVFPTLDELKTRLSSSLSR